jgi:hypothetical protein
MWSGLTRRSRLTRWEPLTKGLAEHRRGRHLTRLGLGESHTPINNHTHPARPIPLTLLPPSKARASLPIVALPTTALPTLKEHPCVFRGR